MADTHANTNAKITIAKLQNNGWLKIHYISRPESRCLGQSTLGPESNILTVATVIEFRHTWSPTVKILVTFWCFSFVCIALRLCKKNDCGISIHAGATMRLQLKIS